MEVINPSNTPPGNSSTVSNTIRAPVNFLALPSELRNEIYKLSACLESNQNTEFTFDEDCPGVAEHHRGFCVACRRCIDGTRCTLCFSMCGYHIDVHILWVNRNSAYATNNSKASTNRPGLRSSVTVHNRTRTHDVLPASFHASHIQQGVEQPSLTKVCKQIRNDTRPMFYGGNGFLFTIFDRDIDCASIFKW